MDSLYPTRKAHRKATAAWCLFDFANSSYTTLIITVAYSIFFREVVVNATDNSGDKLWGIATFIAMLCVVLTSPVLGALADYSGLKKFFLIITSVQTIVVTAMMFTVDAGEVVWAMTLFIVGTIGFEAGYVFYNAFLFEVSTRKTIGRVSGWAWGIGFVGGLTSLAICMPLLSSELRDGAGTIVGAAVRDRQWSFLVVAGFYLTFALPAFFWLKQAPAQGRPLSPAGYVTVGFRRVRETLRHLRQYRETGKFILASLFFNDGITTIIAFSALFATVTFGFSAEQVVVLFLAMNVVALPGAVLAGYLADAIGGKKTLILSLLLWIAVVVVGSVATTRLWFWVMASGAAVGMGSTQAVARSFMAQITPRKRESEFFGFYVLSGKFASITGPLIFGFISDWTGSQRLAVISLLPLFVIGLILMLSIDADRALRAAQDPV